MKLSLNEINISWTTFSRWIEESDIKRSQYARAMAIRADVIFEEMFEIADDGSNDWMQNNKGEDILNQEHVQRSKLRIDMRKWALSKMMPKKYGDNPEKDTDKEIEITIRRV